MKVIKQISVFLENRSGALREFTEILQAHHISMKALCLAEIDDYGVLRIIVDDCDATAKALTEEGFVYKLTPVLAVAIEDKPGSLVKTLEALEAENINLEYTYAFIAREADEAYIILRVEDVDNGESALKNAGIRLLDSEEICRL